MTPEKKRLAHMVSVRIEGELLDRLRSVAEERDMGLSDILIEGAEQLLEKDILTAKEVARWLRLNPFTVRIKARAGEMPGRKIGKEWRFSKRQLLEWIEGS